MKYKSVRTRLITGLFFLFFLISIPLSSQIYADPTQRETIPYTVQQGDTVSKISRQFGVSQNQILSANNIQNRNLIWVGQTLLVPMGVAEPAPLSQEDQITESAILEPLIPQSTNEYTVRWGESLSSIAQKHGVSLHALRNANPSAGTTLYVGQVLAIPEFEQGAYPVLGEIFWPVEGRWVVKGYQSGHRAIDIVVPTGSPIHSLGNGSIEYAGWSSVGYGNMILIDHGDNVHTLYAHLSEFRAQTGDIVSRNEVIGLSGNTGYSTMPHLHLEIRDGGSMINPCIYLDGGC